MNCIKYCFALLIACFFTIHFSLGQKANNNSSVYAWYKIVESSNNSLWSVGQNLRIADADNNRVSDSMLIAGFSNQGATVIASIHKKSITIPLQKAMIIPYGGDGKQKWEIEVSGKGIIKNDIIALNYTIKLDNVNEHTGIIKALKLKDTTNNCSFCKAAEKGNFKKVERLFKKEVKKRKSGVLYDNGPGSGMQVSHNENFDSLTLWLKNKTCVLDAAWDKCQEKIAIYPGFSTVGVIFKTAQGNKEICFHIQEGTLGGIRIFGWRPHMFKAKNILVYKKMSNCPGFIQTQKENCKK